MVQSGVDQNKRPPLCSDLLIGGQLWKILTHSLYFRLAELEKLEELPPF